MRRILTLIVALTACLAPALAQNNWDRIGILDNLKGSLWDNGKAWGAGAAWKPCVVRSRNNYGSLRLAAMLGAAPREFSASLITGYQHSWVLRGGWQLYWQGGVALTLPKRGDLFSVSTGVGVKMPVRDRMRR